MELKFACLFDDVVRPTRKHINDAGADLYLYAPNADYVELFPGDVVVARTGVSVEIPPCCFGWITNKSRNNFLIGGGIVDQSYQGELLVKITNQTGEIIQLCHGDAIAQLLIIPCETPILQEVSPKDIHKEPTERGGDGGVVRQLSLENDDIKKSQWYKTYQEEVKLYAELGIPYVAHSGI